MADATATRSSGRRTTPPSSYDPPTTSNRRRSSSVDMDVDATPTGCREGALRKGKWTVEEEDYANKIISLFNRGLLPIAAGTTLRSYLSDTLHW